MKRPPDVDVADVVDKKLTKIFIELSKDPGDLRRVLLGLTAALNLVASKLPLKQSNDARVVWDDAKRNTHRSRLSFGEWVTGVRNGQGRDYQ